MTEIRNSQTSATEQNAPDTALAHAIQGALNMHVTSVFNQTATTLPSPERVRAEFAHLAKTNTRKATRYLYELGLSCGYIRQELMDKNPYWTCDTPYGPLEISINLAKPEKDPRAIAQAARSCVTSRPSNDPTLLTANNDNQAANKTQIIEILSGGKMLNNEYSNATSAANTALTPTPACDLCWENEEFPGSPEHPAKPGLRIAEITLGNKRWGLQYSPYAYFSEHCIVLNEQHLPMHIDRACFENLFDFIDQFPFYFIGSNADLPIVGGSILSHDHYQGGLHTFSLMKAPVKEFFTLTLWPNLQAGIVAWPSTVIRLRGRERQELIEAAEHIRLAWKNYRDDACEITPESRGPHNTLNPILYKDGETYVFDLVLRNNRTTKERPWGIFHPDETLHHIKKENIGLIEIMGLAILPPRLGKELPELKKTLLAALQEEWNEIQLRQMLEENELCSKHTAWACEIFASLQTQCHKQNVSSINDLSNLIELTLQKETGMVFMHVLEATGVFKNTTEGHAGLQRFLNIL